jgi:hypothetical protein
MLGKVISEILGKMKMTLKEKMSVGTFIISILIFRTFSIASLSLMCVGENLKTKRNKAYEFLKKKFSYTDIFRIIISETAYKKTYTFLLLLIIHGYRVKKLFLLLFLIKKEQYRLLSG